MPRTASGPLLRKATTLCCWPTRQREREVARVHTLRQQWEAARAGRFPFLSDYVAPRDSGRNDFLGAFVLSTGIGLDKVCSHFDALHDDYSSIMAKALADRLAEAFAELLHARVRRDWGYGLGENLAWTT